MSVFRTTFDARTLWGEGDSWPEGRTRSLETALRSAVRRGQLPAGTRLPASRVMADQLSCSRWVVVQTYEQLVAEGYFESRPGSGTYVRSIPISAEKKIAPPTPRPTWKYDFGAGIPDLAAFPRKEWATATRKALEKAPYHVLGYGDSRGLRELREGIAGYLGRVRGAVAIADDVVLSNSAVHAISILARVLEKKGIRTVGVEHPGWIPLRKPFDRTGVKPVAIPVDKEGIDVSFLRNTDARAVLVSPAHQFPTGVVMSPERRTALLKWAEECDGIIIEDDYDAEFRFDRQPISSIQGLNPNRVVLIGSLSKSLAPGVRLGWMVLPEGYLSEVLDSMQAIDPNPAIIGQLTFLDFLASGQFERHLHRLRQQYSQRREILTDALSQYFPESRVEGISAGMHVLADLGPGPVDRLLASADSRGIRTYPVSRYCLPDRLPEQYVGRLAVVLGFGGIPPHRIKEGIQLLQEIVVGMKTES